VVTEIVGKIYKIIILYLFGFPSFLVPSRACPQNWNLHGTGCYFISTLAKTKSDALNFCKAYNAELLTIKSVSKSNFLKNVLLVNYNYQFWVYLLKL
jgi:hypothetical protein